MTDDVNHLFRCLLAISWGNICSGLLRIFKIRLFIFLSLSFKSSLYTFTLYKPLIRYDLQICSPVPCIVCLLSPWCPLRHKVFNFDEVSSLCFFFCCAYVWPHNLLSIFIYLFIFYLKKGFFSFFFFFIILRLITLQYCSGFCHTLTKISCGFTCIPHPNPPSLAEYFSSDTFTHEGNGTNSELLGWAKFWWLILDSERSFQQEIKVPSASWVVGVTNSPGLQLFHSGICSGREQKCPPWLGQ